MQVPKYLTQNEAFQKCTIEGMINSLFKIDVEKIKTNVSISEANFEVAKSAKKNLSKDSIKWSSVYKLYYDSLHELVEAFLIFDKIKSDNHQCLFAYLCEKHPELEFNWDFFEKIRTKRNGVNYYSVPIKYNDIIEIELQLNSYLNKLKDAINKKLKEYTYSTYK